MCANALVLGLLLKRRWCELVSVAMLGVPVHWQMS